MKGYTMKKGFILLALLIVIAIGLLIYFAQISTFQGVEPSQESSPDMPWFSEDSLQQTKLPAPPKPIIEQSFAISGEVFSDGNPRGTVTLIFDPNGSVKGKWLTKYSYPPNEYDLSANFSGRVDPDKTFKTEKGDDPSLLYVFTKGNYAQTAFNK